MDEDDPGTGETAPSKSERKRQMLALQALGESLLTLNDKQLAQIPIEDEQLLLAIRECRQIRSNSARKRHLQFIGKLMRHIDPAPIEQALSAMHQGQRKSTTRSTNWNSCARIYWQREQRSRAGHARWPDADRQQLRQLVLQHQREMQRDKPPAASRKLFRYLRNCRNSTGTPAEIRGQYCCAPAGICRSPSLPGILATGSLRLSRALCRCLRCCRKCGQNLPGGHSRNHR